MAHLVPPPVNYGGGWHRRARVAQVSLATFARASLPGCGQLRPRSAVALGPPQGVRGAGGAWRPRPRTRRLSWGRWILRAGTILVEGLAASDRRVGGRGGPGPSVRKVPGTGWTSPPEFGGCWTAARLLPRLGAPTRHGMGGWARWRGQCFRGAGGVRRGEVASGDGGLSGGAFKATLGG